MQPVQYCFIRDSFCPCLCVLWDPALEPFTTGPGADCVHTLNHFFGYAVVQRHGVKYAARVSELCRKLQQQVQVSWCIPLAKPGRQRSFILLLIRSLQEANEGSGLTVGPRVIVTLWQRLPTVPASFAIKTLSRCKYVETVGCWPLACRAQSQTAGKSCTFCTRWRNPTPSQPSHRSFFNFLQLFSCIATSHTVKHKTKTKQVQFMLEIYKQGNWKPLAYEPTVLVCMVSASE